jgi:hypothetical protein
MRGGAGDHAVGGELRVRLLARAAVLDEAPLVDERAMRSRAKSFFLLRAFFWWYFAPPRRWSRRC